MGYEWKLFTSWSESARCGHCHLHDELQSGDYGDDGWGHLREPVRGRINDTDYDSNATIRETATFIEHGGFKAKIIAGSMRQVADIHRSFIAGAHIMTTSYQYLESMVHCPWTVETIREFRGAWDTALGRGDLG
ncbi:MAG: hypothetical protein VX733_04945 [Candidatus Latescibacterota bacterium]|nr:hypothetical protein [Candidatus Latescibacterota bacterium]